MSPVPSPSEYSFTRYLQAKKSIDDRCLNQDVWNAMTWAMRELKPPRRILELGAGIGTMLQRMLERNVLAQVHYSLLDRQESLLALAQQRLSRWREVMGLWEIDFDTRPISLDDLLAEADAASWDMLVAHAFLDLVDIETAVPALLKLIRPGGLFYFSLNFDGQTILQPSIDPALDRLIIDLYHRTMDERMIDGKPSGDSHTGRHLFEIVRKDGASLLAAGSSDWVVHPRPVGYVEDEAYFLHYIIHTIGSALEGHPDLDGADFAGWLEKRHRQVEDQQLVYIAHQLDILGLVSAS